MKTLLSERFAPTTSSVGFIQLPLEQAAESFRHWRESLYPSVRVMRLSDSLDALLPVLQPLVGGARPRELLVEMGSEWTAYFDCGLNGTDAGSVLTHMCLAARAMGIVIESQPHVEAADGSVLRSGAVQFLMLGPFKTDWLNHVRAVALVHSGSKWEFETAGLAQPFEDESRYRARRVKDRFDSALLESYCRELGVEPFVADAYGPRAVLIESDVPMPPGGGKQMTLSEAQNRLAIIPGLADSLPG